MTFNNKRDRIQIIAEILTVCKKPRTQTYIRQRTRITYDILQRCLMQLLIRQWIRQIDEADGQRKLEITDKGLVFLDKWLEVKKLAGFRNGLEKDESLRTHIVPAHKKSSLN
ncbi:MAG: winged helix-turn-helix domain-containing protein [Candidatus Bathyarchaeota archaeon]|nr:winged helix-turn-helix domain-containing protein [Candidatus Bathyarchaeota archaeon]